MAVVNWRSMLLTFNMGPTKLDGFVESKLGAGKNTNCRRITYRIVKLFDQFPVAWRNKSMIIACEMVSIERNLLDSPSQRCPLLAQSGHPNTLNQCPLLGVKRT